MSKITTIKALTITYLTAAIGLSYIHIAALFLHLGTGWQSYLMPLFIDTVIVIGKLSDAPQFAAKTRRAGRNAVRVGLALSLTANTVIGFVHASVGEILAGVIVVGGALWAETHLTRTAVKAARAPRTVKPQTPVRKPRTRKPATAKPSTPVTHPALTASALN